MLALVTTLALACLAAPAGPGSVEDPRTGAPAHAVRSTSPPRGLDVSRAYLGVSPGLFMVNLNRYGSPRYTWGVEAGYHLARGRFKLQSGLQFEHTVISAQHENDTKTHVAHWLRFGPQLRLGGGNARTIGYGLVGLVLDVIPRRPVYFEGPIGGDTVSFHPSLGAGFQHLFGGRFVLGGEAILDLVSPGTRTGLTLPDPFLRLRLVLGVVF